MKKNSSFRFSFTLFTLMGAVLLPGWCFAQGITLSVPASGEYTSPQSVTLLPGFITTGPFQAAISVTPVPSAARNYILSAKVKVSGITTETALNSVLGDYTKAQVTVQYFDGLGRPMQVVQQQGSPLGQDIVQPIAYDSLGREVKKYLPYVLSAAADGSYRSTAITDQQVFYNNPPAGVVTIPTASGQVPYSETQLEASPLNRIQQQGFPGGDWKIGGSHTQREGYGLNGTNDVRRWIVNSTGASGTAYYPKARLYTDTVTDENGNKTITYTDPDQRVLLRRVQDNSAFQNTYYVYDDLNNLRYVLPPGFTATSFTESDTAFDQFVYGYHYNGQRKVMEQKVPGKGWIFNVYNKLDQLVMSQDAVQRSKATQEWTVFKYDELGRMVLSGIYSHTGSTPNTSYRASQQNAVDTSSSLWETSTATGTGYTAVTYPTTLARTLTISYFDGYTIPGKTGTYNNTQTVTTRTQGLATGSSVNILGTSTMLLGITYFDERGRLKESMTANHLSGTDRVVNSWDFADELTAITRSHSSSAATVTIANRYLYDHLGRKTGTFERIDSNTEVLLSALAYNELGQLSGKSLHGGLQTAAYLYNARGWLTSSSAPLFAMQLKYNDSTTPRYNGDITGQLWGTAGSLTKSFTYSYDKMNRLTGGDTGTGTYEKSIAYDAMGNLTTLNRNGTGVQNYTYSGNRLSSVSGGVIRSYTYDANGNALTDGTNTLTYNLLNLPATVVNTATTTYTYDALGRKLKKVTGTSTVDYVNGIQYAGTAIDFIQTEEGLARKSGVNYLYQYNLTDHLGNSRLSFDNNGGVARTVQSDDYYPYGKTYNSYTLGTRNNYLYNGKELQGDLGAYDYGFRMYDPVVARWTTADPLAENGRRFSPYTYGLGNPIRYIDPDGMWITDANGNQFTTDFNDIAQTINTVVNPILQSQQQQPDEGQTFLANSPVSDNILGNEGDPPKKKKVGRSYLGLSLAISGGLLADDVTGIGAIDDIAIPFIVSGAIAHDIYTSGLGKKMGTEIDNILQKSTGPQGFTYELRVNNAGSYLDARGNRIELKAGDIWKYGETTSSSRYSAAQLNNMVPGGVSQNPIYFGNQVEIKVFEKYLIYGYFFNNGSLPPGNSIFR